MRVHRWLARGAVASLAAAFVVVGVAAPAAAGVVVVPAEATQGDAAKLTFRISNDSPTATVVKVDMLMPADAPIAEVYPLSVENWAPSIVMRTLDKPLESIHGPRVTETAASVTWTAVPGQELAPGATSELFLSVGPLPEIDRLAIGIVVTQSDGAVLRFTGGPSASTAPGEQPAPVIVLKPLPAAPQASEATVALADDGGPSYPIWTIGILVMLAILTGYGLWDQRRRRAAAAEQKTEPELPETFGVQRKVKTRTSN